MKSLRNWIRVRQRDTERIQKARENRLDDAEFKFRGQFYRVLRTKDLKKFYFRRVEGGGTFAEVWLKNPSDSITRRAQALFDIRDVRAVHES